MAARDPQTRRQIASLGADASWARTINRAERTQAARRATPIQFEYHLEQVKEQLPDLPHAKQAEIAESRWRAQQKANALAAAKSRIGYWLRWAQANHPDISVGEQRAMAEQALADHRARRKAGRRTPRQNRTAA